MAGHLLVQFLNEKTTCEVHYTTRKTSSNPREETLDLTDEPLTYNYLKKLKPDVVINTAGILNNEASERLEESIYINSLLPHRLAKWGDELEYRFIHISTDCVFSGKKGHYTESDLKDGTTIYAKTKSLGEVTNQRHVTIRTSIIGPEIRRNGIGLFHWFMKQTESIQGFKDVYWNGVTTLELSKAIYWILQNSVSGLVHLTGTERISKYKLLLMIREEFNKDDISIIPVDLLKGDKTLINSRRDFSYKVLDYKDMLTELREWMKNQEQVYEHYRLM